MTDAEQREAAHQFVNKWRGKGNEDEDGRSYWIDLLQNVLGMENVTDRVDFEKKVYVDGNKKRIDAYIPETRVLIEQKSLGKALDQKIHNSGDIDLTPYEQAKRYNDNLSFDERARWIITCNFAQIWIYDMNQANTKDFAPVKLELADIQTKYSLLDFLIKKDVKEISHEMEISIKAGDIVGKLYDAFIKQYKDPTNEHSLKSLNALCVRLVFCLYAEDAGIFGERAMFHDYLQSFRTERMRNALIELFRVLDQKPEDRDPYLEPELAAFPYVNGGLFSDENIEIPMFTDEIRELLLVEASENFNWSDISPTIFGAVFESTLNPETRRSGGMHYTSIENIHKVIDPLFLDDLKAELAEIEKIQVKNTRIRKLHQFQDKLASTEFLDPAAGSGNFLTETYLSLRRLENRVVSDLTGGQMVLGDVLDPIKVSITQFHGIEINDFAVTVAKTALWIAESQMMKETEAIIVQHLDFLPLTTNANIVEANALRIDWNDVVDKSKLNYIMGNPPFVGTKMMDKAQKSDVEEVFSSWRNHGLLDYVACWYKRAADYIQNTTISCAFVSTNSITQGEQVAALWKPLIQTRGIHINYAYREFVWDSEAQIKAHVHVVIIGFGLSNSQDKILYDGDEIKHVQNINGYLTDAPDCFIERNTRPISSVPQMYLGCSFYDGNNLVLTPEEKDELLVKEPNAKRFIRPYMMGGDFIARKPRFCLWLLHANPKELSKCPEVLRRVQATKDFRKTCKKAMTQKAAETPTIPPILNYYSDDHHTDYLAIPRISSEKRRYIPAEILPSDVIAGDSLCLIPDITLYYFGVITSNVHMAWVRAVCGKLETRYRYSSNIVYNNFPWPSPTPEQKSRIEQTAQGILDARALYPDSSLADLYDPLTMPPELRKAHTANDIAVMKAYGFSTKMSEADCVAELMKMYQALTADK
ncbi:MAG: methylase [Lachnospiraceae bacterium]|nr:methylase [Lachnospiraceae bacterium]MCH4029229.1 methylase [Lachnospiraceae bacterium]MCH4067919.1 methylase [Lachnospiraceae bacterium]MCH4113944.1 methylase [Lachnospiraceae bacterium]MCI1367521.1 methylase [Lachnospiraceae bacterium]